MTIHECQNLDAYFSRYGSLLGQQAQKMLNPLHVPGRDAPLDFSDILREPYNPQAHVITAAVRSLERDTSVLITAQVGTGKTLLSSLAVHKHHQLHGDGCYRAIVMCPPQLVEKWERELRETIKGIDVFHISNYREVMELWRSRGKKQKRSTWWIVSRERAKMGAKWSAAYTLRNHEEIPRCIDCHEQLLDKNDVPMAPERLSAVRMYCGNCGSPLWTYVREAGRLDHWEPAKLIHKKLKGFFDYAVFDEIHELSKMASQQSNALGSISAAAKRSIGLTGTILNGYAESLRPLLFRLAPQSLVSEGFEWGSPLPYSEAYGRIETRIIETEDGDHAKSGRGKRRNVVKVTKPGIMPSLFGRHLISKCLFLSLSEMSDNLPTLQERTIPVRMDEELSEAYKDVESSLRDAVAEMLARGDQRLLGAMLETLLYYPDLPRGWGRVGYWDGYGATRGFVTVCEPPDLQEIARNKEQAIIREIVNEVNEGRQCWVYVQRTGDRDELQYIADLIAKKLGLRVKTLRSGSPSTRKREAWIAKHGPHADVVVSHPQLVETGLDLFAKDGRHNFCTLMFAQLGYRLHTMRQASGRAWRLMQTMPCRTMYFYYMGTMQDRCLTLMGQKLSAALAIEGTFSSEGLLALAGADDGMEMMLARSLAKNFKEDLGAERAWEKITALKIGNENVVPQSHRRIAGRINVDDVVRSLKSKRESIQSLLF